MEYIKAPYQYIFKKLLCQANEMHDAFIDISENLNCSEEKSLADAILDYCLI